jgi:hypothetical protein
MAQSLSSGTGINEALACTNSMTSIDLQRSNYIFKEEPQRHPHPLFIRFVERTKSKEYRSSLMVIDLNNQGQDLMNKLRERNRGGPNRSVRCLEAALALLFMQRNCVFFVTVALVGEI